MEKTEEQLYALGMKVKDEFDQMFPNANPGTEFASLGQSQCVVSTNPGGAPVSVSPDVYWRYDAPPRGVKLFLLTKGGIAVTGTWSDTGGFIGWQHLFKRDKSKEVEIDFRG